MGINMITDMNEAWEDMKKESAATNRKYVVNLLSHSCVTVDNAWRQFCKDEGYNYDNDAFYLYQKILVNLMLCDNEFLQGEYDCYCDFCAWANFKPLGVEQCKTLYNNVSTDDLAEAIKLLTNLRSVIGESHYHALAQGFCHFALLSDRAMDENEYYIIRCFYCGSGDYAPSTWENFKKEW